MNTVKDKDVLMEHVESLRTNLDNTNRTIVELTDQKMNLQAREREEENYFGNKSI